MLILLNDFQFARPGRLDVRGGSPHDDSADDTGGYEVDPSNFLSLVAGMFLPAILSMCMKFINIVCAACQRAALLDPSKSSIHKTTWEFNKSPAARHSDAHAAAAAAAAAAAQIPVVSGAGGATASVTPAMEARLKLEQVTIALLGMSTAMKEVNEDLCFVIVEIGVNLNVAKSFENGTILTRRQFLSSRAANWAAAEFLKVTETSESFPVLSLAS
jgi:hypothetical protein